MKDFVNSRYFLGPCELGRLDHGEGEINGSLHHHYPNYIQKAYLKLIFYEKVQCITILTHFKHIWRVVFPRTAKNSESNRNAHGLVECEINRGNK